MVLHPAPKSLQVLSLPDIYIYNADRSLTLHHQRKACQTVQKHLTDMSIRTLPEGIYFDDRTPSFGIRIGRHRKTWIVLKGTNRTKLRLGHYPALSLSEARRKALYALGSPLHPSSAPLFTDARSEFLAQDRWKQTSAKEITRLLTKHFNWAKTLDKITPADVAAAVDAIHAKSEAAHALKDIKTFFNWCVPRYLPHTPCTGIKPPVRYIPRERLLTNDELARIWMAADTMGHYGRHVQLLITTGQRCHQILGLKDEWIADNSITFPAPSMKNNRTHVIPLGELTASLLQDRGSLTRFQYRKKAKLDALSGVTGCTLHDIRRAFASGMASLGINLPVIERLLAHRSGSFAGIVGVYQHYSYEKETRAAIDLWENHILKITGYSP